MATDRSDKLYLTWLESTEKFDYFFLSVISALCAFIGQAYKASKLGFNSSTLELVALLFLVSAAIAGFRRIEFTLLCRLQNHTLLNACEEREQKSRVLTGGANLEVNDLTIQIAKTQKLLNSSKARAVFYYRLRNALTLGGFLFLIGAKLWSAYQ